MPSYRVTFARILALALCFGSASAWALDPSKPPSGNFDLSHWKEQLPTSNGVLTADNGSVDEIKPSQLTTGWTGAYFYTGADGSMVFWAPDNGASTGGSIHPRSELREEIIPNNDNGNWLLYGTHILNGQCQVLQIPSDTKKIIIGQIHGFTGAALPLVKLEYNNGTLEGMIKTNSTDDNSDKTFAFGKSGITSNIFYQIKVVNGLITIVMNNVTNSVNVFQSDPNWAVNTCYFKAGDYNQTGDACMCSNDGARVAFYVVTASHAPSITNQPANQTVSVGSNVTFKVGALGNPPLYYAWRLDGTNINNATNATLTIPNVQLTNAGTYSVVVTDSVGTVISTVTSSNATLAVVAPAPTAGFTASPTNGAAPLNVAFTDTSSNSPTSWSWTFGDTGTSTLQSPTHTYTTAGVYTVRLIASNAGGPGTNTQTALINVYDPFAWWQLQYFGSTNNNPNTVPGGDYTGTGMSNTNKFLAGFNPTNPAAYLQIISIGTVNGTDVNVIYLGANGDSTWLSGITSRTNVLEFTAGTASGDYSTNFVSANVTNILSGGTGIGLVTNMVDAGGATNTPSRYYRVRVLVP